MARLPAGNRPRRRAEADRRGAGLSASLGLSITSPPADRTVGDGEQIAAAASNLRFAKFQDIPVGHVIYLWKGNAPFLAFVGDVIFRGSVGRTDFYDGDREQLGSGSAPRSSICRTTPCCCPATARRRPLALRRRTNPFVGLTPPIAFSCRPAL